MIAANFTLGVTFDTMIADLSDFGLQMEVVRDIYREYTDSLAFIGINEFISHDAIFIGTAVCSAFAGLVVLVINAVFIRYEKRLARSLCENAQNGEREIEFAGQVRIWLLVVGIIEAIAAVFTKSMFVVGTNAAFLITMSAWIKKTLK